MTTKTATATMTMTTRSLGLRPAPQIVANGEGDDDEDVLLAAPDPLALEPLSDAEMKSFTADATGLDEQQEGALEVLRKQTEAKLPLDPDAADSMPEPTDAHLELRERKARKHRGRKKRS